MIRAQQVTLNKHLVVILRMRNIVVVLMLLVDNLPRCGVTPHLGRHHWCSIYVSYQAEREREEREEGISHHVCRFFTTILLLLLCV